MFERRSEFFAQLFDTLGITFRRTHAARIDNTVPLKVGGRSLQLYFNEANSRWGAYFAAHERLYQTYDWSKRWLPARVGKKEQGYIKLVPYPGQERLALMELISYVKEKDSA